MLYKLKVLYRRWYAWCHGLIYIGEAYWDGQNTPKLIDMTSDGIVGKWERANKPKLTRKYWNRLLDKIEGGKFREKELKNR